MSGIKHPDLAQFLRMIRFRLGGAGVLAQFAGVGRAHLSSMLHGDSARGAFTWPKIRRQVTSVEWSFLEKSSAWNSFQQLYPEIADQVRRIPTADKKDDPIMQVVCSDCRSAMKILRCEPSQGGKVSHGICPACYTARMTQLCSAEEIDQALRAAALADAANPAVIPLKAAETAEMALTPST